MVKTVTRKAKKMAMADKRVSVDKLPNSLRKMLEEYEAEYGNLDNDNLGTILGVYLQVNGIIGFDRDILAIFDAVKV